MQASDGQDHGLLDDVPSADQRRIARADLSRIVTGLPDRLVICVCWFAIVVAVAVILGRFQPLIVLPAAVALIAVTWRAMPTRLPTTRAGTLGAAIAILLTLVWVATQLPYRGEFLVVTRDPGFLTLGGVWLSDHPSRDMPLGASALVDLPEVATSALGYSVSGSTMYSQGASMLPGLLGAFGWVGGVGGVLSGNVVLGGFALLSLYAAARRVMGPLWSLLPILLLGVSMPLMNFARSAYTEPFTMALAFAGLTMALSALQTGRWFRYAVAGLFLGSTAMMRIDGASIAIGVLGGLMLIGFATTEPRHRRVLAIGLGWLAPMLALGLGLGYLDLRWHSPQYLLDLNSEFLALAIVLVATAALLAVALSGRWVAVRRLISRRRRLLATLLGLAVCLVGALFAARPFLTSSHRAIADPGYGVLITRLQKAEGLPVDPTAAYDELSLHWIAWYFGWFPVAVGLLGLALLAFLGIRRRDPRLFLLFTVIAAPSLLYLYRVSITPDQIWAIRRLLPITIPGLLLAAAYLLSRVSGTRWTSRRTWLAVVLGVGLVIKAVTIWPGELYQTREQGGRLGQIQQVCDALTSTRVLYINSSGPNYLPTLKIVCGVDVVRVTEVPSQWELAQLWQDWGEDVSVVFFNNPGGLPLVQSSPGEVPAPLLQTDVTTWGAALSSVPRKANDSTEKIWVGSLTEDGLIDTIE